MGYIEEFVLPVFEAGPATDEVGLYLSFFDAAVADQTPPHFRSDYGESFRRHVTASGWVVQCLVSNAIKEGEGAEDLAAIASACADPALRAQLLTHAGDEARHCRLYMNLIDLVFPKAMPPAVHAKIESRLPPLTFTAAPTAPLEDREMLDCLIQVNLGEVRTRLHQKLLEPVLHAYCPAPRQERLRRALEWIASDEAEHIRYTAQRIGEISSRVGLSSARNLFMSRARDFNTYTERELGLQREGLFRGEGAPATLTPTEQA